MSVPRGFAMGVDLGTSNTVAVVRWPDGRTRPLLVDGVPVLPSGVYLDEHGRLHVGRDAHRLAQIEPARYEPNPKRRIDEGAVLLGDREVPTVHLLATILSGVGRAALEAVGHLPPAALTFPAAWGSRRRDTLAEAAVLAGWQQPLLVPEPVGAARYFADVLRRPVPFGASLAVFDFGGGTLDVAVVRNDGARFSVLGSGGIHDLGGLDVDSALVEHLGRTIAASRPDVWHALNNPATTAQRRDRRLFWDDVRGAKEMLSRVAVAPVTVPGLDAAVHLTREELEAVAGPLLQRAVHETGSVIRACGLRPDELAGLFLVGGSSRLPLAARLLHHDLGIAPTVLEQPELPVAEGAIAELAPASEPISEPVSGMPVSPMGTYSGPVAPVSAGPVSPVSAGPYTNEAMGPAPAAPKRFPKTALLASAAAILLVIALGAAGGWWYLTRDKPVDFDALASAEPTVAYGQGSPSRVASYTRGDVTYLAWTRDKTVDVAAINVADNAKLWQESAPAGAEVWESLHVGPDGVVLVPGSISSSDPEPMIVLDPGNGKVKWQRDINYDDRLFFYEAAIVLQSDKAKAVFGLDWQTGAEKWKLDNPVDGRGNSLTTQNVKVRDGEEAGVPSLPPGAARVTAGDDARLLQFAGDSMRVVDVATGKERTAAGVRLPSSTPVYAAGDKVYLVVASNGYQVREYDLAKLGQARVLFTEANSTRKVASPVKCGGTRLCFIEYEGSDVKSAHVVAVDIEKADQVWREPAAGVNTLETMGSGVLATNDGSTPVTLLFDSEGKQVIPKDATATAGARVNESSVLLFSRSFSNSKDDVALTGVTIDGKRTALGSIDVTSSSCSWNAEYLVCAAEKGWRAWKFSR